MIENKFSKIEEMWEHNNAPINVYINSPFCITKCNYCVYRGNICSNKKERSKYFSEYLPAQIKKYSKIIERNKITSIYYGGGTPNYPGELYNLEKSMKIINSIPSTKNAEKIIELHMGIEITDEDIEFLSKNKINLVILCQQTFNNKILEEQNRFNDHKNNIENLIQKFHKKNIKVGLDLISFTCMKSSEDNIYQDLDYLSNLKELPDEITISNEYSVKNPGSSKNSFFKLKNLPFLMKNYEQEFQPRHINDDTLYYINTFRFFKKENIIKEFRDGKFFTFTDALNEKGVMLKSILGIGSYKPEFKYVYSRIAGICNYYEINDDLNCDPTYNICEFKLFEQAHNLLYWVEDVFKRNKLPICHTMNINIGFMDDRSEKHIQNVDDNFNIQFNVNSGYDFINQILCDELNKDGLKKVLHM